MEIGFDLVVLCRMFGRRGRAFARSLACQRDGSPPIHLTVYYSRPEDADLVREGATSGPNPPTITFRHVPEDRIMQRAMHFSEFRSNGLSHTVFSDADLWFPPNFWIEYASALSEVPPGYWSCRVMDIDQVTAKWFMGEWKFISAELLSRVHKGVRGNKWKGKVGHFQCVPSGLLKYPADEIVSVERADQTFAYEALKISEDKREDRRIGTVCAYHFDHPSCWRGSTEQL